MAVIYMTGWEPGSTTIANLNTSGYVSSNVTRGSWSRYSWYNSAVNYVSATFSAAAGEFYFGFGFFTPEQSGASRRIIRFLDPDGVTTHVSMYYTAARTLAVYGGDGGSLIGTGTTTIAPNRWYYIEGHVVISDSVGDFDLKVDGVSEISTAASQDTKNGGTSATCDRFSIGTSSSYEYLIDDFYVCDTTGSVNTSYLGDVRIKGYFPNAAGDTNALTAISTGATRWYFSTPSVAPAYISPAAGSLWDVNGLTLPGVGNRRGQLSPFKRGTAMTTIDANNWAFAQGDDVLLAQWVSPPLTAQTISGTFKMYMRAREGGAADDFESQVVLRVVNGSGTEQAVLYAGMTETADPPTSEWALTQTNRGFPRAGLLPASLSSYACSAGDRLVVEVGFRAFSATPDNNRDIRVGDAAANDTPEDETSILDYNPWIEFSSSIGISGLGNWELVDEHPPNDALDYVYGTGTTEIDTYNIPNTSNVTSVQCARLWWRAQKDDASSVNTASVLKYDTDANGTADTQTVGSDKALSTSWAYYDDIFNQQPDSTNWTAAKIDALQIGVKSR